MLSRIAVVAAVGALASLAYGDSENRVRALWQDGKSYVWTLEDSGGRGAPVR